MSLSRILSAAVNSSIWSCLFAPVDIASLVFFRIAFGLIMLWQVWLFFEHNWIKRYWMDTTFHFTYWGFDWVRPWTGDGMYLHILVLGFLAVCITLGLWYRISATLFFLGFTYVFLLEQTRYLNHFYLICLISFLMIFIPVNRVLSIDSWRRPHIRSDTVPAWTLWLLRAQIGIVYFYSGLAKLNSDWLHGMPMRMWLEALANYPLIGPIFSKEWAGYLFSYGGLLFDLMVVPLLLWKRTRWFAFVAAIMFHLLNAIIFQIGIFPWFMIAATLLFFPPDWPRLGGRWWSASKHMKYELTSKTPLRLRQRITVILIGIYLVVQLLVPFRHFLYPGNVSWTGEGKYLSWRMLLNNKVATIRILATDPVSKRIWEVPTANHLTRKQLIWMSDEPELILQFSHYIANELRKQGYEQIEIRAIVTASLNYRSPQLLISPSVNLAAEEQSLFPAKWIIPLQEPLPKTLEQARNNTILLR